MIGTRTPVTSVRRRVPPKMEAAMRTARTAPTIHGVHSSAHEYAEKESATLKEASRLKPPM